MDLSVGTIKHPVLYVIALISLNAPLTKAQTVQTINGDVPVFCLDSTGTYQPLLRTNYARLQESFVRQLGWRHLLQSTSNTIGVLTFAPEKSIRSHERISYDVEPFEGGIALLHMHVRLRGKAEDLSGTEMCGQTFIIVNGK